MNNNEKLVLAFGVFILLTAIFIGAQTYFQNVDLATVPTFAQPLVTAMKNFFGLGAGLFVLAYLRNLLGYFRNWYKLHATQEVNFEMKRYADTFVYYGGIVNVFASAIPPPYTYIAVLVGVFIELGTSEFKKIFPTNGTTSPTPAPPAPA